MKVTKIIREYVEERVNEIFAEPTAIEKEYEEKRKQFDIFIENINKEINNYIELKVQEIERNNPDELYFSRSSDRRHIYDTSYWNSREKGTLADKAKEAKQKREQACYKAKKDIFVNLELGANKKELENMFQKLIEEKNNTSTIEE